MELSNVLYLNPNYFIRHDETRSLLWARDFKVSEDRYSVSFHSFIHPYHAEFLSLFNGNNTIEDVVKKSCLGKLFGLSTLKFIEKITGNLKPFSVGYAENESFFPINLLLKEKPENYQYGNSMVDFSFDTLDFKTKRLNFPLFITYMINTSCYTDCIYCYADCRTRKQRQLPLSKIMELLDEIAQHPILDFTIMGGEFFLDNDWDTILLRLKELGLTPTISTKIPISLQIIQRMKEIGIENIQISLDSVNPSIIETLLKVKGEKYLSDMKNTFDQLKQSDIKVKINSVITKYNCCIEEVERLIAFLSQYDNIDNVSIIPAGFSLYKSAEYMPSEESIEIIENRISQIKKQLNFPIRVTHGLPKKYIMNSYTEKCNYFSKRSMCSGNLHQAYIMPNGDVTFCEGTMSQKELVIGNIRNQKFSDVWKNGDVSHLFDQSNYKNTVCGKCNEFDECHSVRGVCWKYIMLGYGKENIYMPDPRCPKSPMINNGLYK